MSERAMRVIRAALVGGAMACAAIPWALAGAGPATVPTDAATRPAESVRVVLDAAEYAPGEAGPVKGWYGARQPLAYRLPSAGGRYTLVLTEFTGQNIDPREPALAVQAAGTVVDLRAIFPALEQAGAYVITAIPEGAAATRPVAGGPTAVSPQVITVWADPRRIGDTSPVVIRVQPLAYGVLSTAAGDIEFIFFYDVAPNSVANFVGLASAGFYDGLTFHRVVPGYVIQGGDPRGDGTGGPGYTIDAELSDRRIDEGAMAMARQVDPNEARGFKPRMQFLNSAGSQFFVSLDGARARALEGKYTVFGKVTRGLDVLQQISRVDADAATGRPKAAATITRVKIVRVIDGQPNPYAEIARIVATQKK